MTSGFEPNTSRCPGWRATTALLSAHPHARAVRCVPVHGCDCHAEHPVRGQGSPHVHLQQEPARLCLSEACQTQQGAHIYAHTGQEGMFLCENMYECSN